MKKKERQPRATTVYRYMEAFRDLIANPGAYTQTEWVSRHQIGNGAASAAVRMQVIVRRKGRLHCYTREVSPTMIVAMLRLAQTMKYEKATKPEGADIGTFRGRVDEVVREKNEQNTPPERTTVSLFWGLITFTR